MLNQIKIIRSYNGIFILLFGFFYTNLLGGELLTRIEMELTQLIDLAKPSVVSITSAVAYKIDSPEETSLFSFWGKKSPKSQTLQFRNVSSGLILDPDGHIITKSSVVKDSDDIEVTLYNHHTYKARFIGFDHETGLAVIKIDDVSLIPAKLGKSSDIKIGKWVAILGNSVGVTSSVSLGIINGIREENDLIQLSALINPGNSGSPIFNTDGEVIGIVAARINSGSITLGSVAPFQAFEGGVAYPVNVIHEISDLIIHNKLKSRPWLGISTQDVRGTEHAVMITRVIENSPAQKAGLKYNDIVLAVANQKVNTSLDLLHFLKKSPPDSLIVFSIKRENQILNFQVIPQKWPAEQPDKNFNPGIDYFFNSVSLKENAFLQDDGNQEGAILDELRMKILKLEEEVSNLKKQAKP